MIWKYKRPFPPDLPQGYGHVNRGLAVYDNTLFVGILDGHWVAINANYGTVVWQAFVANPSDGYL